MSEQAIASSCEFAIRFTSCISVTYVMTVVTTPGAVTHL